MKDIQNNNSKTTAKAKKTQKGNKITKYFRDLRGEWKKLIWPTKSQVINNTSVVLVAMIISGLFIWGMDTAFKAIFDLILQRQGKSY